MSTVPVKTHASESHGKNHGRPIQAFGCPKAQYLARRVDEKRLTKKSRRILRLKHPGRGWGSKRRLHSVVPDSIERGNPLKNRPMEHSMSLTLGVQFIGLPPGRSL